LGIILLRPRLTSRGCVCVSFGIVARTQKREFNLTMVWILPTRAGQSGGCSKMIGRDNLEFGQRSEEVASVAVLVGVADELSVQLLVTGEGDATGLLVLSLWKKKKRLNFRIFNLWIICYRDNLYSLIIDSELN